MFYILNQSFLRIGFIALFYIVALSFYVVYIMSIESDFPLEIISSPLLASSLLPVKPKRLTNLQKSQFTLSGESKDILIGLCLGDLHISKRDLCLNPSLKFTQGIVHEEYLLRLYSLFQNF